MAFDLKNRLVIGIASSALFDLSDSDAVFREHGETAYRKYQEDNLDVCLQPGVAFPFIKRLLSLNDLSPSPATDPLVEVIVLSRNDPDTGLRVMNSIEAHSLQISRAIFMQGKSPYKFIPALNMSLFLSANERDVAEAIDLGLPAGRVIQSSFVDDEDDDDLRIAFDFDGVLADDVPERINTRDGLPSFHAHEKEHAKEAHGPGPLQDFLRNINKIQRLEEGRREEKRKEGQEYRIRVHVALITARNAPSHLRAVNSLKQWGVTVNDAFFLGGVDKGVITQVLKPHIYFDDQQGHLERTARNAPSVHVPFGELNRHATESAFGAEEVESPPEPEGEAA